jgi:hypothetical protein
MQTDLRSAAAKTKKALLFIEDNKQDRKKHKKT